MCCLNNLEFFIMILNHLITLSLILSIALCQRIKYKDLKYYSSDLTVASTDDDAENYNIMIAFNVNNQAYSLPTFLATLETLKCPNKNSKCHLWVTFDKCVNDIKDTFIRWLSTTRPNFDQIIMIDTKNDAQTKIKHVF